MTLTTIYLILAILNAVAGLVSLLTGDGEHTHQWTMTAILWLIAAGVWRERR